MKTFFTRTLSGFVYAVVILGSIAAGPVVFGLVMGMVLSVALYEFHRMVSRNAILIHTPLYYLFPLLVYLSVYLVTVGVLPVDTLGISVLLVFLALLVQPFIRHEQPVQQAGVMLLALFYLVFPLLALGLLYFSDTDMEAPRGFLLFSVFVITWVNDTFAYMTGSLAGKHKLAVAISPNKTWEGSLGGLLFSLAGAYALFLLFGELTLTEWLGMALITVVFGSLGDLFESLLKRSAGLKESGTLIPGHGGILDRFDSVLLAAPFVYLYLYFIVR